MRERSGDVRVASGYGRTIVGLILLLVTMTLTPWTADAARNIESFWVTDGLVRDVAVDGQTLYLGGLFTRVAPYTGGFVPIDAVSEAADASFPDVAGSVYAAAPDGAGGWYIAGNFTHVDLRQRTNLAHVLADNTLSAWAPTTNAVVRAIVVSGSRVIIGGDFTNVSGSSRSSIAAVDAATGALDASWNPGANNDVLALLVSGNTVYVAGRFGSIGGYFKGYLAALDADTGTVIPTFSPNCNGVTNALIVDGGLLYAGGSFSFIGGASRSRLAALDPATGAASSWNPGASSTVETIAVSGGVAYVGGWFTTAGGSSRSRIAAIDATTGFATAWNPGASSGVYAIAVAGSTVYAGGAFSTIGGVARKGLAAIDATTGVTTAWDPGIAGVSVVELHADSTTVHVGGGFWGVGGEARERLAALDTGTGELTSWNPGADSDVMTLAVSGSTVYAGGYFVNAGGQARNRIVAIDATTGSATAWNPSANNRVLSIATIGGAVYAGGDFTNIGGQSRFRLAELDGTTGFATTWSPFVNATVVDFDVVGSSLYVAGSFTSFGGWTRNGIAEIIPPASSPTSWNPNAAPGSTAVVVAGGVAYVGGSFSNLGGAARNNIGAVSTATGLATSWNPNADDDISDILIVGDTVYASGSFMNVGGDSHNRTVAVTSGGTLLDWDPEVLGTTNQDDAFCVDSDGSRLFIGGAYKVVGRQYRRNFAATCIIPVPTGVNAVANGNNLIDVSWTGTGAPSYSVYRSTVSGGPYELLGTATTGYSDDAAQGGVTYYYVIAANDGCESDSSAEASAVTSGACQSSPSFEGLAWLDQTSGGTCGVELGWAPASSTCGGSLTYSVYRSTDSAFLPAESNRVITGSSGTTAFDTGGLAAATTYYYVVRASDSGNGAEDQNLIRHRFSASGCTTSAPNPVATLTSTAYSTEVTLEWVSPAGTCDSILVLYRTDGIFPTGPTDPSAATAGAPTCSPGVYGSLVHSSLTNGTTHHYSAFVFDGTSTYSAGRSVASRPFATSGACKWAYSTGASALAPAGVMPGIADFAVSNDRIVHSMQPGSVGGQWPAAWAPAAMNGPSQSRPAVLPLPTTTVGGASKVALVGSQDGRVYAINAASGAKLWASAVLGSAVQASPSAMLKDYGGDHDLVLVGTRTPASDSAFLGLNLADGSVAWTFDNGGGSTGIGIISSQASVDYANNRVYFTSRARAGGSSDSVWCLSFDGTSASKGWSVAVGDMDGPATLVNGVVYVGTTSGLIHALDAVTGSAKWAAPFATGDGASKAGIWWDAGRIFFSTNTMVHAVIDNGASTSLLWSPVSISDPSPLLMVGSDLYLGSSAGNGSLLRLDVSTGTELGSVVLGDPGVSTIVGSAVFDVTNGYLTVGSEEGVIYSVEGGF